MDWRDAYLNLVKIINYRRRNTFRSRKEMTGINPDNDFIKNKINPVNDVIFFFFFLMQITKFTLKRTIETLDIIKPTRTFHPKKIYFLEKRNKISKL